MLPSPRSRSVLAGGLVLACIASSALAAPSKEAALPGSTQSTTDAEAHASGPSDAMQSRSAARSRMRECGHQWSSMKKNGSVAGMTWKDFSQGCLAKQ